MLVSLVSLLGQSLPDWVGMGDRARPPELAVRDDNGFFNRGAGALGRISARLRDLDAAHGFKLYLIVEPALIGTSAPELAEMLQDAWLPGGNGLVVVYETDSRTLGFGRYGGSAPDGEAAADRVPPHVAAAILNRVRRDTETALAPEAYVERLMANLADEFAGYFERRQAPPPAGRSLRLGLLTVGALSALALGAILVGTLSRLPSVARPRVFRFPAVDRPERLGAPCGGGNVTTRGFGGSRRA